MNIPDEILIRLTAASAAAKWRAGCNISDQTAWQIFTNAGTIGLVPVSGPRRTIEGVIESLYRDDLIVTRGHTRNRHIGPTPLGCRRALDLSGFSMVNVLRFMWRIRAAEIYADKMAGVYTQQTGNVRVDSWVLDPKTFGREWNRPANVPDQTWLARHREMFLEAVPGMFLGWLDISFCGGGWLIFNLEPLGHTILADPAILGRCGKKDQQAKELFHEVFDIEVGGAGPLLPEVATPSTRYFGEMPPTISEAPAKWPTMKGGTR